MCVFYVFVLLLLCICIGLLLFCLFVCLLCSRIIMNEFMRRRGQLWLCSCCDLHYSDQLKVHFYGCSSNPNRRSSLRCNVKGFFICERFRICKVNVLFLIFALKFIFDLLKLKGAFHIIKRCI